jgi:hypothetical protein
MNIPLHASINVGETLPHRYFAPPSTPDRPITKVEAYFNSKSYLFERSKHGESWTLLKIV